MTSRRRLIVNADDFGLDAGISRGIIAAHERGVVTSTSLMVRGRDAEQAVTQSHAFSALGLGLHLDLGEWAFRNGEWVPLYQVVPIDSPIAVSREVDRQLESFRELVGRDPTHIDSHQHVHQREPIRSAATRIAAEVGVPLRHETASIRYLGRFYGQTTEGEPIPDSISVAALLSIIETLPPGITELCCHPGYVKDTDHAEYPTMYSGEREMELSALCEPRVREAIAAGGIELCSFEHLRQEN
ncbi:MAG: ChbG/HpnK family deacetylase [Gemmatimonadota bacterium]|nr:ChbG/HpnK family deacetylase [Gemmatimonadota bacterium]